MNSNDFAKIFRHDTIGQILVTVDTNEEGAPSIIFRINIDSMFISSTIAFTDIDKGWEKCQEGFDALTEKQAFDTVENLVNSLNLAASGED